MDGRSSRRRNGKPASCEPCRKDKVRCDHTLPTCDRNKQRGITRACIYHPAPLTRIGWRRHVNVVGGGPITPVSVLGSVSSPGRRGLSFDGVETNIPLSSGYFGPTSFVTEFAGEGDKETEGETTRSRLLGNTSNLDPYWITKLEAILRAFRDFSVLETLIRESSGSDSGTSHSECSWSGQSCV
jgi:hypothetical protein